MNDERLSELKRLADAATPGLADSATIALVNAVPELLAEIERLRNRVADLERFSEDPELAGYDANLND